LRVCGTRRLLTAPPGLLNPLPKSGLRRAKFQIAKQSLSLKAVECEIIVHAPGHTRWNQATFQSETRLDHEAGRMLIRERFEMDNGGKISSTENRFVVRPWTAEEISGCRAQTDCG